ncbi:MAG: transporter [Candidatus Synechococcus spongiarum 142]|uniref:Transporter n=1 Tax=Candidatus Synechococcus spongiarum 142 TaxID=1608213 RepID=A0A6N3X590_9SYNE|nr:MAG: transporter [Candidatus Synechococcus spongiarum 142]
MPQWLKRLGSSLLLSGQTIAALARGHWGGSESLTQMHIAGPDSFLVVVLVGVAAGTVFNVQVASELTDLGLGEAVGGMLAVGLAREIAPILSAVLITGKVATAYSAELGTMVVTEQVDAIKMLRTDPVEYLVVPRVVALLVMTPLQTIAFFMVGMVSGAISCSQYYGIPPAVFWQSVREWMDPADVPAMVCKGMVFGLVIALVACGWGLSTQGGPREVGASTTGAVVVTLVLLALVNVALTQMFFG